MNYFGLKRRSVCVIGNGVYLPILKVCPGVLRMCVPVCSIAVCCVLAVGQTSKIRSTFEE